MNPAVVRGWAQAVFSVFILWGLNNVMIAYSAQVLEASYLIYTCSAFVSCSLCLLLIGGKGDLVKETLRSVDTWAFGLIMLIGYVLTLSLFSYVTSTEGSLLQRISLLFSVLISWLFLARTPTRGQLAGALLVLFGIAIVCNDLPEDKKGIIYLLMFLEGLALTGRMFVAEIHRPHKQAMSSSNDPRAKARVVGFVMFVISTVFLSLTAMLATLQTLTPLPVSSDLLPTLDSFLHTPSIVAGMVAGVVLLAPLRIIEFSSANLIKTENFLAIAAFSSVATYFWEWVLQPITGMALKSFSETDLLAGAIITAGSLIAAISNIRRAHTSTDSDFLESHPQDPESVSDSREILANTLEHFGGDIKKSAEALDVPESVIEALLNDKGKLLAFKAPALKKVARKFRKNVALSDALTGLANRAGFMTALKTAEYEAPTYSVLYVDLDKFKPVNDTYGHEAGDFVLRGVAERLGQLFPKDALSTRLGGDEFATLLLAKTKEEAHHAAEAIKTEMAKAFQFNEHSITIGASVGIATFPEDGTDAETLLKVADEGMYRGKKAR